MASTMLAIGAAPATLITQKMAGVSSASSLFRGRLPRHGWDGRSLEPSPRGKLELPWCRLDGSGAAPSSWSTRAGGVAGGVLSEAASCGREALELGSGGNPPQGAPEEEEPLDTPDQSPPPGSEFLANRRFILGTAGAAFGAALLAESGIAQAATSAATTAKPGLKPTSWLLGDVSANPGMAALEKGKEARVYEASVLGEPVAVSDKSRVWQKLLAARVVYLGEAESVPDPTDKVLELAIVRRLRDECFQQARPLTVALSAFPRPLQPQLNLFQDGRLSDEGLQAYVSHWPAGRWEEHLPLLHYCRDHGVRIYACGTPEEILRTVQARGVRGLPPAERRRYAPPPGGGLKSAQSIPPLPGLDAPAGADGLPNQSLPFGPGPYRFAQARIVADHTMAQAVGQAMADGAAVGLLVVITGASHVKYGARGRGVPARVAVGVAGGKLYKSTQVVVLLNPERQLSRAEGDVPEADLLWYSGARACRRNCFDRAAVARVMGAAGRRREALPQDLQAGLERGLVSPDTLQSFLDLESQPIIAEATKRFQGLRERWLADPRFLQRLCLEEAISISTTLMAQYQKRGERFWSEIEYVMTDTIRGAVVDFFTVWLPAPTLSFRTSDPNPQGPGLLGGLKGLLGSLPDNAFQRAPVGDDWSPAARAGAVLVGGLKLAAVGFVSSVGTVSVSNVLVSVRQGLHPQAARSSVTKRPPVVKTAVVYGAFLGTSANLRYQAIAGLVEHWAADYLLASQPLAGAALSFVARTANSYWGTGQWVDLARRCGLQAHKEDTPGAPPEARETALEASSTPPAAAPNQEPPEGSPAVPAEKSLAASRRLAASSVEVENDKPPG